MALPVMTPEQRKDALAKAAATRKERATALAEVRQGKLTLAGILADENHPLQNARIRQVLLAVPGVGPVTVGKILTELGVDAKRRIVGLGPRQREALTARLS